MSAATLEAMIRDAANDLFAGVGLDGTRTGTAVAPGEVVAVMSFADARLRGCFVLEISRSVFLARDVADQTVGLGEFANQLMGRFKHRLFPYGIDLATTLPVLVRGQSLEPIVAGGAPPHTWEFATGWATLWFQFSLTGELTRVAEPMEVLAEGRGVLF